MKMKAESEIIMIKDGEKWVSGNFRDLKERKTFLRAVMRL